MILGKGVGVWKVLISVIGQDLTSGTGRNGKGYFGAFPPPDLEEKRGQKVEDWWDHGKGVPGGQRSWTLNHVKQKRTR